jgi:hypothetical protein
MMVPRLLCKVELRLIPPTLGGSIVPGVEDGVTTEELVPVVMPVVVVGSVVGVSGDESLPGGAAHTSISPMATL